MNGTGPKIEIIAPLSQAMELMKRILFRPFNLEKWLVIGFAAFLAHLGGGGRFNLNVPANWRNHSWRPNVWPFDFPHHVPHWFWPVMFVVVPLGFALAVVLAWIGSRGRFIFTDCVVRERGAIVAPWHEYRKEGNSLFLFRVGVGLIFLALFAISIGPVVLPAILHHRRIDMTFTLGFAACLALLIIAGMAWWMISMLMVPVMYRQRCNAWNAFQKTIGLITANAAEMILFVLFLIALSIGLAVLVFLVGLLTCCIGLILFAVPYVGTVILLPVELLIFGYLLLFLRQFGNEWDVWGTLSTVPLPPALESLPAVAPESAPPAPPSPPSDFSESPPPQP